MFISVLSVAGFFVWTGFDESSKYYIRKIGIARIRLLNRANPEKEQQQQKRAHAHE